MHHRSALADSDPEAERIPAFEWQPTETSQNAGNRGQDQQHHTGRTG